MNTNQNSTNKNIYTTIFGRWTILFCIWFRTITLTINTNRVIITFTNHISSLSIISFILTTIVWTVGPRIRLIPVVDYLIIDERAYVWNISPNIKNIPHGLVEGQCCSVSGFVPSHWLSPTTKPWLLLQIIFLVCVLSPWFCPQSLGQVLHSFISYQL